MQMPTCLESAHPQEQTLYLKILHLHAGHQHDTVAQASIQFHLASATQLELWFRVEGISLRLSFYQVMHP
jgi:hypothetical protein